MRQRTRAAAMGTRTDIAPKSSVQRIKSQSFYGEYHGHRIDHLQAVHDHIRRSKDPSDSGIIFLAGDSTLDNKYWFTDRAPALNCYEEILEPPTSVKDIAYWLNYEAVQRGIGNKLTTLNCAVEESTVGDRSGEKLLPPDIFIRDHVQRNDIIVLSLGGNDVAEESTVGDRSGEKLLPPDIFIRDHVQRNDIIVLSLGGNDVALKPTLFTIINMLLLLRCSSTSCIELSCGRPLPCANSCCGCLSTLGSSPIGYGYFLHLFGTKVQAIARKLCSGAHKPKKIVVCMLYYLDAISRGSWAEKALAALGYNDNPGKLQAAIRRLFAQATARIAVPGTEVVAVPLFAALDGTISDDYVQRVEPSAAGGAKMAVLIMDQILADGGKKAVSRHPLVAAAAAAAAAGDSDRGGAAVEAIGPAGPLPVQAAM